MKILNKENELNFRKKYIDNYNESRFYKNIDLDEYRWFISDLVDAILYNLTVEIVEPYYKLNAENKPYKDYRTIKVNIIDCEIEEPNIEYLTLLVKELYSESIECIRIKIDSFFDKHKFGDNYSKYYVCYSESNNERRNENLISGNTNLEEKYRFIFLESK